MRTYPRWVNLRLQILSAPGTDAAGRRERPMKVYIDQIAELAAESVKAASLTPLRAHESAPLSHREAGRRENAIIETQAEDIIKRSA
jgi:hypothetical protein